MLNVKFIKFQPTTYGMQFKDGVVKREGVGLAFFYYAPTTATVAVPTSSEDSSFDNNKEQEHEIRTLH